MTFDLVAPFYDTLARLAFGQALVKAQLWVIEQVEPNSRVLVLGGGTGSTLPALMARKPAHVWYVEASVAMLNRAKQRIQSSGPITFLLGTELALPTGEQFDYILLPFVLDIYPVDTLLTQMLPQVLTHLRADGQLIVTDFDRPQRYWQQAYMWLMLHFFQAHSWHSS